jgi:Natural resistance-associated macrophage protein
VLSKLDTGLVRGESDDDPGIATYSQVGAQFGYTLHWTMVLSYPLMAAIQEVCGRSGRVTGFGLADQLMIPPPGVHANLAQVFNKRLIVSQRGHGVFGSTALQRHSLGGGHCLCRPVLRDAGADK